LSWKSFSWSETIGQDVSGTTKLPSLPTVSLRDRTFRLFQHLDILDGLGQILGCLMTGRTQLAVTRRDGLLDAAQRELAAFEWREREFSKKERQELAAQLRLPTDKSAHVN